MADDSGTPCLELGEAGSLFVEEQRFSLVPEWVIDSALSDAAFRMYSLLLRYGNSSGCRMPSRALLARRLRRSVDSVDRAMRELSSAGVVRVERRHNGRQFLSNRYYVRTTAPSAVENRRSDGGRKSAATPSRTSAARVAADLRPYPEISTDTPPPTPVGGAAARRRLAAVGREVVAECGIADLDELATRCATLRRQAGRPTGRWSSAGLLPAITMAVRHRGWAADRVEAALLAIAADPATKSPMRLAEAGPWWDVDRPGVTAAVASDVAALSLLEARLDEVDGLRPRLQAKARAELAAEGLPVTRATVTQRACALLDRLAEAAS
jgi:hypothetical protein